MIDKPIEFPYEDYSILGDTAEIDKILNTCGRINIDVVDVRRTLSHTATNYIVTGIGDGEYAFDDAFCNALAKLPVKTENIFKLLLNIWVAPDFKWTSAILQSAYIASFKESFDKSFDICWGMAIDDSLSGQQVKITLLAASKEPNIAWDTRIVNNNKTPNQLLFQDLMKLFDEENEGNCEQIHRNIKALSLMRTQQSDAIYRVDIHRHTCDVDNGNNPATYEVVLAEQYFFRDYEAVQAWMRIYSNKKRFRNGFIQYMFMNYRCIMI